MLFRKRNKANGKKAQEEFSFYMEEKQTRFLESIDSDIKKLVSNAVQESTLSQQNMLSTSLKVNKVMKGL